MNSITNYHVNPMCNITEYEPSDNPNNMEEGPYDCYLFLRNKRSGRSWAMKIKDNDFLDLEVMVRKFLAYHFGENLNLQPSFTNRPVEGHFSARIITDKRPPNTTVVWESGGFNLQSAYEDR